jgi:hypothetical protein
MSRLGIEHRGTDFDQQPMQFVDVDTAVSVPNDVMQARAQRACARTRPGPLASMSPIDKKPRASMAAEFGGSPLEVAVPVERGIRREGRYFCLRFSMRCDAAESAVAEFGSFACRSFCAAAGRRCVRRATQRSAQPVPAATRKVSARAWCTGSKLR